MAASLVHRLLFATLFVFFLFLTLNNEVMVVESKLCERRSKTWTGFCGISGNCDNQCRKWEHASHGACHAEFPGVACFCYFNC
ncbi:hypothetical protein DH2020_008072 [Rehmannia glutinosa]|uniref:Knottins-like domain-containing protein n=1 Tax=Rehmannia glutinosa TaxID=99300 RepID=A0ABR0TZX8_REHGL